MAFVTDKEELKPGLIIFRRGDVDHRMWYCRMKMPKANRYKTVSLKTSDKEAAREYGPSIKMRMREGTQGVPRSTYCFRHTCATLRLQEGVDVYFLVEQMGTSVHMIEQHYGHVNTIKHADRVLQGMAGWELPQPDDAKAKASKAAETNDKGKRGQRNKPR